MQKEDIYEVFIEVKPERGSHLIPTAKGGYVCVYTSSENLETAISNTKKQAKNDKLEIIDLQQVIRLNLNTWTPYDEAYPTTNELRSLFSNSAAIYGPFESYDEE